VGGYNEKYYDDGGLRSRTSVKNVHESTGLKQQLQSEIEILTQRLGEMQGKSPELAQSYKEMISSRVKLLKQLK